MQRVCFPKIKFISLKTKLRPFRAQAIRDSTGASLTYVADQRNVVAFQHDLAQFSALGGRLGLALLEEDLLSLVQDAIHIFVKANDSTFNSEFRIVVEPNLNS